MTGHRHLPPADSRSRALRAPRCVPGWESAAGNENALSFPGGVTPQVRGGAAAQVLSRCCAGAARGPQPSAGGVVAGPPKLLDTLFQQRDPPRGRRRAAEGPPGVGMGTRRPPARTPGRKAAWLCGPSRRGGTGRALTSPVPRFCLSPWPGRRARGPPSSP